MTFLIRMQLDTWVELNQLKVRSFLDTILAVSNRFAGTVHDSQYTGGGWRRSYSRYLVHHAP